MTAVYEISSESSGGVRIVIDALIENYGYLKDLQELNINVKYFKGLEKVAEKLKAIEKKNIVPIFEPLMKKTFAF